jgi:hypothetical protein
MEDDRYGEGHGPFRHQSHSRPVTRRQFLGQGFLTGAAMIAGPTLLGLLRTPAARAQAVIECGIGGALGNRIPIMVFDLGGGASIAGSNALVRGAGGGLDELSEAGYSKMGLPPNLPPAADPGLIDLELGIPFHSQSALLDGIRMRASATTLARVNGTLFAARSDNDTGNNPHNPMYGLYGAGRDGSIVTLVGTTSAESGGRSIAPPSMVVPAVRPTKVSQPSDATGLIDTGKLIELLDSDDAAAVMLAAQNITDRKMGAITEQALVEELIQCSFRETTHLVANFSNPSDFDPRLDPVIQGIFPEGVESRSEFRKTASVMKLVANDLAGAGTVEFGGYDYHDSTRATGERKDRIAGEAIGAVLEYAALRQPSPTPIVVYVISDGSVASDGTIDNSGDGGGKGIWKGDNSGTAATLMLVYDPQGRPEVDPAKAGQIGHYKANGSVDTDATIIANEVELLAQAAVLNYVALHNEVGSFDQYVDHRLGSDLDSLIGFAPLLRFQT